MAGYPAAGMRAPAPYPPRSTPPTQTSSRPSGGSIMQGTPLSVSPSTNAIPVLPRTDGLIRPTVQGRDSLTGSITQGTPIVTKELDARSAPPGPHPSHPAYEAYYRGLSTSAQPSSGPPVPRLAYQTPDPQSYSRQMILSSDYLLSQQMVDRNSGGRRDRDPLPLPPQIPVTSRPSDRPPPISHAAYPHRSPSPMYVQKPPYGMDPHHGYPPHSSGGSAAAASQQQQPPPPQQLSAPPPQQQQQQQQQRQGVIQRNSSVPSVRQPDSRPSPPAQQPNNQGRTSSPAGGLLTVMPTGGGGLHPTRPNSFGGAPPVSISPRGDSIHGYDAFASLVNAAAAQPSLPVPDRDRRDREKERDPRGPLQPGLVSR